MGRCAARDVPGRKAPDALLPSAASVSHCDTVVLDSTPTAPHRAALIPPPPTPPERGGVSGDGAAREPDRGPSENAPDPTGKDAKDDGADSPEQSDDLVLIRLSPGQNGVELVAQLRQQWRAAPSAVLDSRSDPAELRVVLATSAAGQASAEQMTASDLGRAIRAALGTLAESSGAHLESPEDLERQIGMLNSVLQIVAQVHGATTAGGAMNRAVRASSALLGARISLDAVVEHTRFRERYDPYDDESLTLDAAIVAPLTVMHGDVTGELRCERLEQPFDHAEEAAAAQIAHAAAIALEKHVLMAAQEVRTREGEAIVAMVSHDLLAPVQTFLFGLEALRAGPTPSASSAILASLGRTTDHMRHLLEDLLDVGRIHYGKLAIRAESVPPSRVLSAVVEQLGRHASQKHLDLTWEVPADPAQVVVDERRLRQALDNLVGNAIRHARGSITLRVTTTDQAVRFHVLDDGSGVPEEERTHVFERLQQGSDAASGSLGLGLFIVNGIARAHGGRAGVDDAPGGGSDFWIEVPRLRPTA